MRKALRIEEFRVSRLPDSFNEEPDRSVALVVGFCGRPKRRST
jgi:hypothetical protein